MAGAGPHFNRHCFFTPDSADARAAIGVSACLLGQPVRYDGGAKYLAATATLREALELLPICPEVGAGLSVPRPPVQLVAGRDGEVRARGRDDSTLDVTEPLQRFAAVALAEARTRRLCGYLWKSRSPSCGMGSTPLFAASGAETGRGSGIQAAHFLHELPWLACCEETDLHDETAITSFILRCRLMFDLTRSAQTPLRALHEHYGFLREHFDAATGAALATAVDDLAEEDYLTAFQRGCSQVSGEELLNLFY